MNQTVIYTFISGSWLAIVWFRQIISAVKNEYGYQLYINQETKWEGIDQHLKQTIEFANDKRR